MTAKSTSVNPTNEARRAPRRRAASIDIKYASAPAITGSELLAEVEAEAAAGGTVAAAGEEGG